MAGVVGVRAAAHSSLSRPTEETTMSDNPNVAERTPEMPARLEELGSRLLDEARSQSNGRSAITLTPSDGGPLKQTLIAVQAGSELQEHPAPGPSSIFVLSGSGTLTSGDGEVALESGCWAPVPTEPHRVRANDDLVALLTVTLA
jgi:quercetin dioxygenase-like cupin family protein